MQMPWQSSWFSDIGADLKRAGRDSVSAPELHTSMRLLSRDLTFSVEFCVSCLFSSLSFFMHCPSSDGTVLAPSTGNTYLRLSICLIQLIWSAFSMIQERSELAAASLQPQAGSRLREELSSPEAPPINRAKGAKHCWPRRAINFPCEQPSGRSSFPYSVQNRSGHR